LRTHLLTVALAVWGGWAAWLPVTAAEERLPERTYGYIQGGRTFGCVHHYAARDETEGKTHLTLRETKSKFRLLVLGSEVDLDVDQVFFSPPGSDRILGFAIRQKTKDVLQFTEGALTPKGLVCRVIRNGEVVLEHTVRTPPEMIIPHDTSFIPKAVKAAKGAGGKVIVLSVESLGLVEMQIAPAGTEEIRVGGRKRTAERYDVVAGAKGTPQALRKRSRLYFDLETDEMLLSVEDEPSRKQRRRIELSERRVENALRRFRQRGDGLRPKKLPSGKLTYLVRRDGVEAGTVEAQFEADGDARVKLTSTRTLGADVEKAEVVITPQGFPVSYKLDGAARLISATGEPVEKPYSLECGFQPRRITRLYVAGETRQSRPRPLDGKVFLFDRNAPELFAVIASQLELKLGAGADLGVYHARDGEAAIISFTVVSSGEGVDGPYYVVHVRGRTWVGQLTVSADGTLLRADRRIGGVATFEYILKK